MSLQSRILAFLDLRSRIALTIFGLGFLAWGFHELRVGAGAALEEVELSRLEEGYVPATPYLRIGEHVCLYHVLVYSTKDPFPDRPAAKVEYALVPIAVTRKDGADTGAVADTQARKVTVVLKTKDFAQVKDFPEHDQVFASVQGTLIHQVEQLSQKEKNLLYSINPHPNYELWVLDAGREPWPLSSVVGMMSVGGTLLLVAVGVTILDARRGQPPVTYEIVSASDEARSPSWVGDVIQVKVDSVGLLFMSIVHALAGVTAVFFLLAVTSMNPCLIVGSLVFAGPFNLAFWTRFRAALGPEDTERSFGLKRKTWLIVLCFSYGLGVFAAAWLGFSLRR
jgi:hypothetical protein